jgi:NAD(P)-dependent dehydrogenase (short-subunit alcohol dehydrogenase family)
MKPFIDLTGKTYLVVGASSGIGEACALGCAELGAKVIAASRRGTVPSGSSAITGLELNVRDDAQIAKAVQQLDPIDGLIYSAGRTGLSPVTSLDRAMFADVMETNFSGFLFLLKELMRARKLKNGGAIVTIASIAAHTGTEGMAPYTASKAALSGVTKVFAREFARRGIRVNSISPAMVRTPFFTNEEKEYLDNIERKVYHMGLGEPADIAAAAVFYLSDRSNFITGSDLIMTGGCTWVL